MGFKFISNAEEVKRCLEEAVYAGLEGAIAEIQSQAESNTPVDEGQLKGAWAHYVDEGNKEAVVGNPLEYSIYTEYGTGEYALKGNGRDTPWRYQDKKGNWHTTTGKPPVRMLFNAFNTKKNVAKKIIEKEISDAMNKK